MGDVTGVLRKLSESIPLLHHKLNSYLYFAKPLRTRGVKRNTHRFACAAALEEVTEEKTFENRPSNTYANYLRPRFKKKDWAWLSGVEGWTAFLEGR